MCVWMNQVFLKEGTLMKLSRKVMQPRVFFLVSGPVGSDEPKARIVVNERRHLYTSTFK